MRRWSQSCPITFKTDNFGKDSSPQQNKASADTQYNQTHFTLNKKAGEDVLSHIDKDGCMTKGCYRWATHHQTRQVRNSQLLLPQSFHGRDHWNHAPNYPKQSLTSSNSHKGSYQHIIASHQELNVEWTRDSKGICNLFCSSFYL